jgi:hypothetical protein
MEMKFFFSVFLITVVLLGTLSRSVVLLGYELNKDFISTVLCVNKNKPSMKCNGQCHLRNEMKKEEKRERSPAGAMNSGSELVLFIQHDVFNFHLEAGTNLHRFSYLLTLPTQHFFSEFHPPEVRFFPGAVLSPHC